MAASQMRGGSAPPLHVPAMRPAATTAERIPEPATLWAVGPGVAAGALWALHSAFAALWPAMCWDLTLRWRQPDFAREAK